MILITGATGLTGSHLALHLLENEAQTIRAIYRKKDHIARTKLLFELHKKASLFDRIEWIQADVIDIPSLEITFNNISEVYHCAALISFDPGDEEILRKTNIEGTANIVNLSLQFGVKKLCYVSSIAALGDAKENEHVVTEEVEWNPEKPHNDYGISKHGAEMEIWRGQQEGLAVIIVNPGIIIGPPLWKSGSSQLFALVKNGQHFYTNGTMGFVSVTDVVKIMVLLMKSDVSGERFVVSAENLSYREMFNLIADVMKKSRPVVHANSWMTEIAWRIDWFLSTVFMQKRKISKYDARTLHSKTKYSSEKVKRLLDYNFTPLRVAVEESVGLK